MPGFCLMLPMLSTLGAPHTSTLSRPGSTRPRWRTHSTSLRRRGRSDATPDLDDVVEGTVDLEVDLEVVLEVEEPRRAASASRCSSSIVLTRARSSAGGRRSTTSDWG